MIACAACNDELPVHAYIKAQLRKGRGMGRCWNCVKDAVQVPGTSFGTRRHTRSVIQP